MSETGSEASYVFREEEDDETSTPNVRSNSKSSNEFEKDVGGSFSHDEAHKESGKYIKSIIYGGLDGIVSVFVSVAAVSGTNVSVVFVLILGIAKLLAGAISMGVGDWLSTDASVDVAKKERKREEWEVKNFVEGEIEEMVELYVKKGVPEEDARKIMTIFAKDTKIFVDIMMAEELGISIEDEHEVPWKHGLVNFGSFMAFGIVPLLAYIILVSAGIRGNFIFYISIGVTLLTLVGMGIMKGKLTGTSYWKSGVSTVLLGGFTAFVGWIVGFVLNLLFPGVNIG